MNEPLHCPACDMHGPCPGIEATRTADRPSLRPVGNGYEVLTWVGHQPSEVVVLPGHPQLGGRYCMTDGGDWPCAAVRQALEEAGG